MSTLPGKIVSISLNCGSLEKRKKCDIVFILYKKKLLRKDTFEGQ